MSNLIPFTIVWFLYEGWQRIKNFFFPFFFWWLCSRRFLGFVCPFCMFGRLIVMDIYLLALNLSIISNKAFI